MSVSEMTSVDQQRWEEYLTRLAVDHHAFHWQWRKVLSRCFGHTPRYFVYEEGDELAIAPVFHFHSRIFGQAFISVPYLSAGGIRGTSQAAVDRLYAHIERCAQSAKVDYVELRQHTDQSVPAGVDASRSHKVAMVLDLLADPEALFSSFPPKLRSQIRRPTKSGLYVESFTGDELRQTHLDDFYSVFSEHMRDLGTPVYPKALFRETTRAFRGRCRLLIVRAERKPVAVGITIGAATRTEILWASSLRSHNQLSPNMLLYWEAIKHAATDGYQQFDFGRSTPDTGTYRFKKQWGATPEELSWHYRMFDGEIPDVNPANPKFSFLVSCWRKLPVPVANLLGPYITRGIP